MRVLIATDAWRPHVCGVVRTLTALAKSAPAIGLEVEFLSPEGFPSFSVPTYPGLRLAVPDRREIARRIEAAFDHDLAVALRGELHGMPSHLRTPFLDLTVGLRLAVARRSAFISSSRASRR